MKVVHRYGQPNDVHDVTQRLSAIMPATIQALVVEAFRDRAGGVSLYQAFLALSQNAGADLNRQRFHSIVQSVQRGPLLL